MAAARAHGVEVLPVDSEHNAVHECTHGGERTGVRRIILTASGGPFRGRSASQLSDVSAADALQHPTWPMGRNHGRLGDVDEQGAGSHRGLLAIRGPADRMRCSCTQSDRPLDGGVRGRLADGAAWRHRYAAADPVCFQLLPERWPCPIARLDLARLGALQFGEVDRQRFRSMYVALAAARAGRTYPAALSGADDEAVRLFLAGALPLSRIADVVETVVDRRLASRG